MRQQPEKQLFCFVFNHNNKDKYQGQIRREVTSLNQSKGPLTKHHMKWFILSIYKIPVSVIIQMISDMIRYIDN